MLARAFGLSLLTAFLSAAAQADDEALARSVQELRDAVGSWGVSNEFLNEDGSVAQSVPGTYEFEWVIEDHVLQGRSEIPDLGRRGAILFYVREATDEIEMVSVGNDGRLWIMTGPLGGDTRFTQIFETQSGGEGQLRFTRYNVTETGFESRMEWTEDGGKTWRPGNHQVFVRQSTD
jgi:hypothetical protein